MKRLTHIFGLFAIGILTGAAMVSCTEEELIEPVQPESPPAFKYVGNPTEAYLDITVEGLTVSSQTKADSGSYGPVDDTEAERMVYNLWVFQYDAENETLISDSQYIVDYLTIDANNQELLRNVPVTLSDNNGSASVVYVVTNTDDSSWGKPDESYTGFTTLTELKQHTIPNPTPIRVSYVSGDGGTDASEVSIPMGGSSSSIVITDGIVVKVPVRRMFAKLITWINLTESDDYEGSEVTSFMIDKIPNSCTVATNYVGDDNDEWYFPSTGAYDVSRNFDPGEGEAGENDALLYGPFIIYIPENLQGDKSDAVRVTPYILAVVKGAEITSRPAFPAYPGSWSDTSDTGEGYNYDVQRNCVYYITMNVEVNDYDTVTPSANCLIGTVGTTLAFYPYVRDEKMSDELQAEADNDSKIATRYTFSTYLDPTDGSKTIKGLKIIWQTNNCIGDNSNYDLVTIDSVGGEDGVIDERHRKIYVTPKATGNALIAAYNDKDCEGDILWSWHIWVPEKNPESSAIEYAHLQWSPAEGIVPHNYVPGRLVMNLNLGAIAEVPSNPGNEIDTDTFGTLYQWGRKDPFPPMKIKPTVAGVKGGYMLYNYQDYSSLSGSAGQVYSVTLGLYDNDMAPIDLTGYDGSLGSTGTNKLFYTDASTTTGISGSSLATDDNSVIVSSIKHPTMFIAAAAKYTTTGSGTGALDDIKTYKNEGDWLPDNDDFLWGGGHPGDGDYQVYSQDDGDKVDAYLENDYGPEKTIFDPCPYGWRISPGDLWLGFTEDGLNTGNTQAGAIASGKTKLNCDINQSLVQIAKQAGYYMYMQGWHEGLMSYFPIQGTRVISGQPYNIGPICGNYHNATVDNYMTYYIDKGLATEETYHIRRVDILHLHSENTSNSVTSGYDGIDGAYLFINPFTVELHYYDKAVAGPVRCVRDTDL